MSSSLSSKRGDPSQMNYRPISLALLFQSARTHVLSRIGSHICPQLDESQGGFRWGADCLVVRLSLLDIQKALIGVSGCMWRLLSHVLRGTQSQVRSGDPLGPTMASLGEGSVTPFGQPSRESTCSFSASGSPWSAVWCVLSFH